MIYDRYTLICPTCCCTEATATLKCMPGKKEVHETNFIIFLTLVQYSSGPMGVTGMIDDDLRVCTGLKIFYTFWTDLTQVE